MVRVREAAERRGAAGPLRLERRKPLLDRAQELLGATARGDRRSVLDDDLIEGYRQERLVPAPLESEAAAGMIANGDDGEAGTFGEVRATTLGLKPRTRRTVDGQSDGVTCREDLDELFERLLAAITACPSHEIEPTKSREPGDRGERRRWANEHPAAMRTVVRDEKGLIPMPIDEDDRPIRRGAGVGNGGGQSDQRGVAIPGEADRPLGKAPEEAKQHAKNRIRRP